LSSYWKKKLEELNAENEKKTSSSAGNSSNYWQNRFSELENGYSKKTADIAPVKQTEDEDERKWFQKGAFEDGYQFGDVLKTVGSSARDLKTNIMAGVLGIGEAVVDAGAYIVGGVGGLFSEDFKEDTKEFIAKDLYDEKKVAEKLLGIQDIGYAIGKGTNWVDMDEYSAFGDKTDALAQSGGQLLGTAALQSVGVPWFVTTGVTSFGGEVENAFNQGATYGEAGLSGAITAGAEILTEKISGGIKFGGSTLDDVLTKKIAAGVSNRVVRTAAKLGMDVVGEGSEEVLSGLMGAIGQKITYADDKELTELFSKEDALEAFIGGAALGGTSSGFSAVNNAVHHRDATTGLTKNEEAVFKKVYEDAIAEKEQGGKKLTAEEKSEIYDDVMKALERGEISTDTIEEALGGDTFKTYQNAVANEESLKAEYDTLKKEYDELYQMKHADKSDAQIDRQAELKQKMESIQNKLNDTDNAQFKQQLKDQMRQSAYDTVAKGKDAYLAESYNEKARRGQAYEADLSKYSAKQQEIVKKAVDSGILNNTRRSHELVDLIAKLHEDKGVDFDFHNNEKLKGSSYAVDGKFVNGYYDKANKKIGVNIDSKKYLNTVVGHEITHVLEGTELYNELQTAMFEYAKTKGEYESRRKDLESLYRAEDIDTELTADLVGDYLFHDRDFINNLSAKNRNVFQKIYDEIKYFCKIATAGSKEARELEKVKRAFEQAYKADAKQTTAEEGVQHSISSDSDGKQLSKEQVAYFKDSKMRDENGNLKVMYHGSQDAGFHVFDSSMSDDDTSFFFVDRNEVATSYSGTSETYAPKAFKSVEDANKFFAEIGHTEYEVVEKDGKYTLLDDGDEVATTDSLDYIYEEWRDWSGLGYGDANYKVYLNLTNPLEVDAKGRPWNKIDAEFSQEVYDKYQSLTAEEKAALTDLAEWEDFRIFNSEIQEAKDNELASAYAKMGEDCNIYDLFSVAADNFSEDSMRENARKYLKTRDFAQRAKEQGYDGVIFKNIIDNGGYSNGSEGASTVAIAFNSNQIKSVANEKPTGDPDIRFSLSKSVEESGELMAIHNLSEAKLMKALKLGGLPMPSVAIAKAQDGHSEFGDISLVLPKETIDPKSNRNNKLYSGDAWTPTYPSVEYKLNRTALEQIRDKLESIVPDNILTDFGRVHLDSDNMTDSLNRYGGNMVDAFKSNYGLKYAYLADTGVDVSLPMKEKNISYFGSRENGAIIRVAEAIPAEELKQIMNSGADERAKYEPIVRKAVAEYVQEAYGHDPELLKLMMPEGEMSFSEFDGYVQEAYSYHRNGIQQTVDESAARELINKKVNQAEYEAWLGELFSDIVEKEGIRNNVDFFTPSGNRRSFEALHYEHSLENVVRAMRDKGTKGIGVIGGGNIFGASTTEFSSIEEMKQNSDRLKKMSQDEYDEIRKEYTDRFFDLAYKIPIHKDSFSAASDAGDMLVEAVSKYTTRSGIANYLRKESRGWANYSEDIVDELIELVNDIRKMPTGYFESKPQRAVGFDEVGVFVIPNNADVKLKQELLNRGYAIAEYDPDVEGSRQKVVNSFEEYKFSLSDVGETPKKYGNFNISGDDVRLDAPTQENIAPIQEDISEMETTTPTVSKMEQVEDFAPMPTAYELRQEQTKLEAQIKEAYNADDANAVEELMTRYSELVKQADQLEKAESAMNSERLASLTDADAPAEFEAPYYNDNSDIDSIDPFEDRDIKAVGNRKVKAYMYENPEVKPFFQAEANVMLGELENTTKGERFYTPVEGGVPGEYGAESYGVWTGTSRHTSDDIAYLLDTVKMSYDDIEKGLNAIIKDNGAENIAAAKKIEFILNDRLLHGYRDAQFGYDVPADQDYINLLNEKQITEYNEEAKNKFFENADLYAPMDDLAPVSVTEESTATPVKEAYEAIKPKQTKEPSMKRIEKPVEDIAPTATFETKKTGQIDGQRTMFPEGKTAKVLTEEPKVDKKSRSAWSMIKNNVLDKGMVFEDLSLETGNRELQARWNSIRYSEGKAQKLIGEGNASVSSLKSIQETVENSGKTSQFYEYLYHLHNVDRMSLEEKAAPTIGALRSKFGHLKIEQVKAIAAKKITDQTTEKTANTIKEAKVYLNALETKNKPVFGDSVTAEVSKETAAKLEKANPEFKEYAKEVYDYMNYLRDMLVDGGVISSDTAKLWAEMYPHYVPIRRQGDTGLNINVPLDTGRTGVNAPIKRATGGNRDILPLFDTMAMRTEQTYKAIAKNRFGVELKNTLGTTIADEATSVDDAIDSIDAQDGLLQEGKNGNNPTFTVFENGKKVTFEITEEMYDAMKPTGKGLSYTNKVANTVTNVFRGLLTEYNPVFMATNAVKDAQDILINSQHARKTYAAIPKAIKQMATKGHWYQEYLANGGEQNTYFDGNTNTFKAEDNGIKKVIGMPLRGISFLNNTIERVPRLAEYIASREAGQSVDVSMLDAARVTTNFAAGGDVTKFLNRNGFNFLNASMQGAMQQARNVREAKANGLKGWVQLASKVALAGIPALILNNLLWDDDEEYEELSDYVKDNYYVVAKFGDGKFVRIPKGRTLAVIQDAFEQVSNALTGDDEVDLKNFLDLAISNLAPNNPLENNILAPIMQVKNNKTWYGEDLVPTRLQDLPDAEQYDESTDAISKWLGEKLNYSPYKLNYLLNQYSGGVGDVILPMLTPEAESGDNSLAGNILAPWKDKFTTDSTMNNQNVSDFYDAVDELTKNAKSSYATDEDVLKYKYMNSVNSDLGELYKKKREIQNSDLDDSVKYERVRTIQEQINALARESLNTYNDVYISDGYAVVGDRYYKLNDEGEWTKISDKQLEKQEEVTDGLGIDPSAYWSNKTEYDFAYEYPEKYAVAKSVGGYESYKTYSSELYDIKADKDEDGKSIVGSRKEKVIEYVNNLDVDYGIRLILFKNEYNADDTYNYEIIEYLNSRDDISYEDMETILKELGFTVKADGTVTWD
jgi:hypothetical protein